jgi:hypothetical protein
MTWSFSWWQRVPLSEELPTTNIQVRANKKQIILIVLKWVLTVIVLGIILFFTLFGIDFNSRISPRDYLAPKRLDSGALSSEQCFQGTVDSNKHFGLMPSVPVKEDETCFDYASLIKPVIASNSTTTFHTYWSTSMSSTLTENQLASLRSLIATQPSETTQLKFWVSAKDKSILLKPESLWHTVPANTIQLETIDSSIFTAEQLEHHTRDLLKLSALYTYGGVWFDLDVLFVRDMSPLLQQEWLSQATCFERSPFASSTTMDSRFAGSLMHMFKKSPYLCEMISVAKDELTGTVNGLKPLRSLNVDLYARVYYRLLKHRLAPWAVLPWCYTDPSQCKSYNSLPDAFDRGAEFDKKKLNAVFTYHWHNNRWNANPGSIFKYLTEQHQQVTHW